MFLTRFRAKAKEEKFNLNIAIIGGKAQWNRKGNRKQLPN
jgi:hypothetical protein